MPLSAAREAYMARLKVEVAYATAKQQEVVAVSLEEGARAIDAVRSSGLAERHRELRLDALVLGVFGALIAPQARLRDGDRVEIYRALIADPKDARRRRAAQDARAAQRPRKR